MKHAQAAILAIHLAKVNNLWGTGSIPSMMLIEHRQVLIHIFLTVLSASLHLLGQAEVPFPYTILKMHWFSLYSQVYVWFAYRIRLEQKVLIQLCQYCVWIVICAKDVIYHLHIPSCSMQEWYFLGPLPVSLVQFFIHSVAYNLPDGF